MTIGDTVWVFDALNRVYKPSGRGAPDYRSYFVPHPIIGETRTSWVLGPKLKVDKATMTLRNAPNGGVQERVLGSQREVDDAVWVYENAYTISRRVQDCKDATRLRAIEALLDA